MRHRVVGRNPQIVSLSCSCVTDAGEGEMAAGHPTILISRHLEYAKALLSRCLRVCIKRTPERWIRKLQRAHKHQITHHNQCLSLVCDNVRRMTRSVPMRCKRTDAGRKPDIFLEALEFSGLDVRCKQVRPERNPAPGPGRVFVRMEKDVHLMGWRSQHRVGKRALGSESQTADVIGA